MPACDLDHLVVAAATLDEGARFIQQRLGVEIPMGGCHPGMGTHNRLMRIAPASYLEVIAIDPQAVRPDHPRWYALDDPTMREQLSHGPRLITWVARACNIVSAVQAVAVPLGSIVPARRSALSWRMTVPADGTLPVGGVIPHLIEWDRGLAPWLDMADFGCRLIGLTLTHPDPVWLEKALLTFCATGFDFISIIEGDAPKLSATISTPLGIASI